MKMVTTSKYSKRVEDDDGGNIGQVLMLANGRWAPFDMGDKRLVDASITFSRPQDVLAFFKAARS